MKKLIIGLVIGLLIGSMGSVLAATDTVQAVFAKFNIKINDNEPIEIQPLTYGGKTYLPVREVGDLLGYEVGYDGTSKTITLNKRIGERTMQTINMNEWISLRDLVDIHSLFAGQTNDSNGLFRVGNSVNWFEFDSLNLKNNDFITVLTNNNVEVRLFTSDNGFTYIKIQDLIEAGLINQ